MPSPAEAPHAAAIARAEARRTVLERVTRSALVLMDEQGAVPVGEPADEARDGAVWRFVQLARAVRRTVALGGQIDAEILALRKTKDSAPARPATPTPAAPKPASAPPASEEGQCAVRDPIQAAVWSAIEQCVDDEAEGLHRFDRLYERLFETREYDRLDLADFEGAVRAICADLGLEPDWTLWDGSDRFLRPLNAPRDWSRAAWRWRPDEAEARRARLVGSRRAGKAVKALARAGPFKLE